MSNICVISAEPATQADDDPPQRISTHPDEGCS